jgi:Anti-sigma-K factor rskA
MSAERCPRQIDVAGFLMGALSPEEHASFSEHLIDCHACEAEMSELVPVMALLDAVAPIPTSVGSLVGDAVPDDLRRNVISAVGRAGSDAVLASVRGIDGPALVSNPASSPASHARFDRRLLAAAAAFILLVSGAVLALRSSQPNTGAKFALVAVQKDPLSGSAQIKTASDNTTSAEFIVNGTVPGEIYFAWFEDPEGKRISLGSFRGANGSVRFRGQTGVARANIVAVGASTKAGDTPTDRMRAELPKV